MYGYDPYAEFYEGAYPLNDDLVVAVEAVVIEFVCRHAPPSPPRPIYPSTFVGWSQPPRPADVVVSFDPRANKRDQARSVLYDYYHDDSLRGWSDNEAVKRCFIGGKDARKENHDTLLLIAAYENPNHRVWQCQYSDATNRNVGTGMHWHDLDKAVQQAIARRRKLGPLPKSTYDPSFTVIYYYDNDKMKRITYPGKSIPPSLNEQNNRWWAWGMGDSSPASKAAGHDDVHTRETDDPKKIAVERAHPGWITKEDKQKLKAKFPWLSDMESGSAGDWTNEQFNWDKDVAGTGVIGSITGAILALVSAVLDVTGVGAVIGVPLGIATPFIVAAINATDTALHAGDFGAALANLGPALAQAAISAAGKGAGAAGFNIPPQALKALSGTVTAVANDVAAGQQKKLEFGDIWAEVASKAQSYGKLGDDEAEAIAHMLGGPGGQGSPAGHVFVQGYLAGKFLDMPALKGIAKILQGWAVFGDPRIINIALLGMGIGYLTKAQSGSHAVSGMFNSVGQIVTHVNPHDDLAAYVHFHLKPRYGLNENDKYVVGFDCPPGYDPVGEFACAYHKKASCLRGFTNEFGKFVCSEWDFPPCPPGMTPSPSGPRNWCYSSSDPGGRIHVGDGLEVEPLGESEQRERASAASDVREPVPDYGSLARGCPTGMWWDPISAACRQRVPLPPQPLPHVSGFY